MTLRYPRLAVPLFSVSMFASAALLFVVQPMFARMVLPRLGGSPAVWNTCVLFFQIALLLGYFYAHLTARWLAPRRQVVLHLLILLTPLLVLPFAMPGDTPPASGTPVWWLLGVLLVAVGLPFFVVASTAPMLQHWFSVLPHPSARDPYFLYVASNAGSMLGLLGYPFVIEPSLRLADQSLFWAAGYIAGAVLIAVCGATLFRFAPDHVAGPGPREDLADARPAQAGSEWRERLRWVALAFVPSSLMLGVTTHISMELAAVPLLWVIPLALYLLTFMLTFARRPPISHVWLTRLQPLLVVAVMAALSLGGDPRAEIPLHLGTFFVTAMVCHRELAERRPAVRDLTVFYLWVAAGGALGGVFNTLVAPALFTTIAEYPLVLAVAALLRPSPRWGRWGPEPKAVAFGLPLAMAIAVLVGWNADLIRGSFAAVSTTFLLAVLAVFAFANRVRPFAMVVGLILLIQIAMPSTRRDRVVHAARSFFGIHQVVQNVPPTAHLLWHGNTLHGRQQLGDRDRCAPTTYFHPSGPIGQVFAALGDRASRVAVIGLGSGSLACYAPTGGHWTFYEIDAEVERIARDDRYFTFLRNSRAAVAVVLGDGRRALADAPAAVYDAVVVDAYGSDAIPMHLLTEEFVRLALSRMQPGGVLAFHITNRYLDLEPVLAAIAARLGLEARIERDYRATRIEVGEGKAGSDWMVMTRDTASLGALASDARWQTARPGVSVWTDDFSNLLDAIAWRFR